MVSAVQYVTNRLNSLGFDEYKGEFNRDNLPRNFRSNQFHLRYESASSVRVDQVVQNVNLPIQIFFGFSIARDSDDRKPILEKSEMVISDLGNNKNFKNTGILGCFFSSLAMEQPDENRRFVLLVMEFNIRSLIALR